MGAVQTERIPYSSYCFVRDHPTPYFRPTIRESHLQYLWAHQLFHSRNLLTEEGQTVTIRFSGFWNQEPGPDFLKADILIDGIHLKGDIELHLYPSDWQNHRHHRDPKYANVILHVTLWRNRSDIKSLTPLLVLEPYLEASLVELTTLIDRTMGTPNPALLQPRNREDVKVSLTYLLDEAGTRRLASKKARFQRLLAVHPLDEVLYQEIMVALGYKHNKLAFYQLAKRVPYSSLREVLAGHPVDPEYRIRQSLLYASGLQQEKSYPTSASPTDSSPWRLGGIRPANHPVKRIQSMSHLLASTQDNLVSFFQRILHQASAFPLKDSFSAKRIGNWIVDALATPHGLGKERGLSILFNVLLPFFDTVPRKDLSTHWSQSLYHLHPPLVDNTITRHMAARLFQGIKKQEVITSVRRQMGLIQLFKEM